MNPILLEPIAAKAAHAALTLNPLAAAPAPTNSSAFQNSLSAYQGQAVTLQGLSGLSGSALQQKIATMSESQKLSLAQQLVGATVHVQNSAGQLVQGTAGQLQVQGGHPFFNVAGQNYSLSQLFSVDKPATV